MKQLENRIKDLETDIEKKQHELEQTVRDHQRTTSDHHGKVRQLEHELDEQRRENVCLSKWKNRIERVDISQRICLECSQNGT